MLAVLAAGARPAAALSLTGFKNELVSFLLERISIPGQFEIAADTIDTGQGRTRLLGVRISDRDGVWFTARTAAFSWSAERLLAGEVHVDRLELVGGHLRRLPVVPETAADDGGSEGPSLPRAWPRSPIKMRVASLVVQDMRIDDTVLAQSIRFDATGSAQDEGQLQSVVLRLERTDGVEGSIDLSLFKRFDSGVLRLRVKAREAPGGLVAATAGLPAGTPASLDVDGRGGPTDWAGSLDLSLPDVLEAAGQVNASWAERVAVNAELSVVPGPRLAEAPRRAIGERATLALELAEDVAGTVAIERAALRADALSAAAEGRFDRRQRRLDVTVEVVADADGARRLAPLIAPAGFESGRFLLTVQGPLDAPEIAGTGQVAKPGASGFGAREASVELWVPTAEGAEASIGLVAADAFGPGDEYRAVFGPVTRLDLSAHREGSTIHVHEARLEAQALWASATGRLRLADGIHPDMEYRVVAPEVAPLARVAGVALRGRVEASGVLDDADGVLQTRGAVTGKGLVLGGRRVGTAAIDHATRFGPVTRGRAALRVDGEALGQGRASASFEVAGGTVTLHGIDADVLAIRARGDAVVPVSGQRARADLELETGDLSPLGRFAGVALSGSARGELRVRDEDGGTARLDARLERVSVGETRLGAASLQAALENLDRSPRIDVELRGEGLQHAGLALDRVDLAARGPLAAVDLEATLGGRAAARPLTARLAGTASLDRPERELRLTTLDVEHAGETVRLARPATIKVADGSLSVESLALELPDDGRLQAEARVDDTKAVVDLRIDAAPLRVLGAYGGSGTRGLQGGRLDGRIAGSTGGPDPSLEMALSVSEVRHRAALDENASLSAQIDARWDGRVLEAAGRVTGAFDPPLEARARLPMRPGEGPIPALPATEPIEAEVSWAGTVESLFALLPLPDHLLFGAGVVDLRVGGTLDEPLASGVVSLRDGRYENLATGTVITPLTLETDFSQPGKVRLDLEGSDGVRGKITATAAASLDALLDTLDASATMRDFLLLRIDAATAEASGEFHASGREGVLRAGGTLTVQRAEVRLLDPTPPSIVDLGEIEIAGAPPPALPPEPESPLDTELALTVLMPGELFVRGRGLNSEWQGKIDVTGSVDSPRVAGGLEARRGYFDFVGRPFELTRGRVDFDGGEVDPYLDVVLERVGNTVTGRILVSGRASAPSIEFASVPPLPPDEVLPQVLYNRSRLALSATEALQLAAGVAALTTGRGDALDSTRSKLGVDVLRVETDADNQSSLSVGRYATDKVYVGAKQSLDGANSSVVVEYRLRRNLMLDVEVEQDADGSVGLTWQRDF